MGLPWRGGAEHGFDMEGVGLDRERVGFERGQG